MNFLHIMTRVINYEHNVITRLAIVAYHLINSLKGNLRLYLLGRCQEQMMLTCVQCSSDIFDKHFCHFSLHQHPAAAIMNNNNTFAVWDASSVTRYYVDLFFWAVSVIENLSSSIKIAKLGTKVGQLLNKNHTKISQKIVISLPNLVTLDARIWKRNILCHLFLDFFRVFFLSFFLSLSLSLSFVQVTLICPTEWRTGRKNLFEAFRFPLTEFDSVTVWPTIHFQLRCQPILTRSLSRSLSLYFLHYLFVSISPSLSISFSLCVCIVHSLSLHTGTYFSLSQSFSLFHSLSIDLFLFICLALSLSFSKSLFLFQFLFLYLSVHIFLSLSPCMTPSLA